MKLDKELLMYTFVITHENNNAILIAFLMQGIDYQILSYIQTRIV